MKLRNAVVPILALTGIAITAYTIAYKLSNLVDCQGGNWGC